MVIFPLAPDQTIAQMWSNGARGGMHTLGNTGNIPVHSEPVSWLPAAAQRLFVRRNVLVVRQHVTRQCVAVPGAQPDAGCRSALPAGLPLTAAPGLSTGGLGPPSECRPGSSESVLRPTQPATYVIVSITTVNYHRLCSKISIDLAVYLTFAYIHLTVLLIHCKEIDQLQHKH